MTRKKKSLKKKIYQNDCRNETKRRKKLHVKIKMAEKWRPEDVS